VYNAALILMSNSVGGVFGSRDLFKFWDITDDVLETAQDSDMVTMED